MPRRRRFWEGTTPVFWCMTERDVSMDFERAFHQSCLQHLIRRCREMIQGASSAAAQFPLAVKTLLQQGLRLRDRYQAGSLSAHGLAGATGRLEAQLDRMLDRHFRRPDNQRLAPPLGQAQPPPSPL